MNASMKKLTESEIKKHLLEILIIFDSYCEDFNLTYFLGGGTLLGAVRHKGFIPWDDDIDVMMPRDDYHFLVKNFNDYFKSSNYKLESIETNVNHLNAFGKIVNTDIFIKENEHNRYIDGIIKENLNLYIDVFPIDGTPSSKLKQKIFFLRVWFLKLCRNLALRKIKYLNNDYRVMLKIIKITITAPLSIICKIFGYKYFIMKLHKFSQKYNYSNSIFVAATTGLYGTREIVPKSIYDEKVYLDFEGHNFTAPIGYELYLTNHYGDFMELPPIDKRIDHLGGEVYVKID